MHITFFGAAGEVTGSCYLVETGEIRFLVDCGLFQGGRDAYRKNLAALDFSPKTLDFVLVSHAHLDHSGLLPRLAAMGYRGPIYTTEATADLLGVMLLDSAHIQEKEAEWENRHHHGKHARRGWERAPLYTVTQAQASLRQLRGQGYHQDFLPHPGVRCRFLDAGHILGSAIIELWLEHPKRKLVFSGDLGQPARLVVRDPEPVQEADILLLESTYGDRLHRSMEDTERELTSALLSTLPQGNAIIPAFSVGRTQELLFVLTDLIRKGALPPMNIYVDSPMSMAATRLTLKHEALLDDETLSLLDWQHRHPDSPHIRFVQDVEESMALNTIRQGAVIISASGMCDAGRIKYHLLNNLPRKECAILITGFQAQGSLGRRLVDGAHRVTIFGQSVPVKARVHTLGGLSAHADQKALLGWLGHFRRAPARTFIVHGEARASESLAAQISERYAWPGVLLPQRGKTYELP
jgi:metallo-beta-lactamase family protein